MTLDKKLTGAQILAQATKGEGVDNVFFYTGGAILKAADAAALGGINFIEVGHEGIAALAASGYARATGKVGTVWATSGPGGLNCVTAMADAKLDSVPLVLVTGQVSTGSIGKDAFQEANMFGTMQPNTKYNSLVTDVKNLARIVKEAYYVARTGRPGPVHIDLPKDVQFAETVPNFDEKLKLRGYRLNGKPSIMQLRKAAQAINNAKKPVLYVGGGVVSSDAAEYVRRLAMEGNIPVTTTLMARGVFPEDDNLGLGMIGMHGTAYSNIAVNECDLLIAAGVRFDDRVTGDPLKFAPNARIIHIDVDPSEIGKNVKADIPIVGDAKTTLEQLCNMVQGGDRKEWVSRIQKLKSNYPLEYEEGDNIKPQGAILNIYNFMNPNAVVTVGVGQHQMWAAQHYHGTNPRSFLSSSGLGTMGFGVPAAIGAQIGLPEKQIIVIDGDGSFNQYPQALGTIAQYELPIKIFIINNGYHGMVKQWQHLFFEGRVVASQNTYQANGDGKFYPDFVMIAKGYGVNADRIDPENKKNLKEMVDYALTSKGPFLLDIIVDSKEMVYPMIPSGGSVDKMLLGPGKTYSTSSSTPTKFK